MLKKLMWGDRNASIFGKIVLFIPSERVDKTVVNPYEISIVKKV